jgi:hypothetical protein
MIGFIASGLAIATAGCRNSDRPTTQEAPASTNDEVRKPPSFDAKPSEQSADVNRLIAEAMLRGEPALPPGHPPIGTTMPADAAGMPPGHPPIGTTLPAGHPPIGTSPAAGMASGTTLPAGHPPIGQNGPVAFSGDLAEPEQNLQLNPPESWKAKPARPMTVAIYDIPKANENSVDAELAISHYPGMKNIALDMQVKRWAGQFKQPEGADPMDAVKQSKLDNANHPTTLIDISGAYQAGSMMMGPSGPPKDNYRLLVAIVETDKGPWFFKLVGPQDTLAAREAEFKNFVRNAK